MSDSTKATILPLDQIHLYNSAFSAETPGLQLVWDNTSYDAFSTCAFYYFLRIVQGIAPKTKSIDLVFGTAWHGAIEQYNWHLCRGLSHKEALFATIRATMWRQLRTPAEHNRSYGHHEESLPVGTEGKSTKTPLTLLRALIHYLDEEHRLQQEHPERALFTLILPDGTPAVELSFRFALGDTPYQWAGHFDRIVSIGQRVDLSQGAPSKDFTLHVLDYKTTVNALDQRYWAQFSPDIQMTGYTLASRIVLPKPAKAVLVHAAQLQVTGERFDRQLVTRTPNQIDEFTGDLLDDIDHAKTCAERQSWPMNRRSCRRYGRDCEFRQICNHEPNTRATWIKADFTRHIWNPTEER